ncbi:MAG: Hsp70 family protein [Phycisphaerales bacterium]|nr:Hsp70 family protein [Phycisphaerales bacterium]
MNSHDSHSHDTTPPIILGIDLGTTNSLVAIYDATGPRCLPDSLGRNLLPSVVRLSSITGELEAIGSEARTHAVEHPTSTVYSIKR